MPTSFTAEFLILARPTDQKIDLLAKQFKLTPEQIELCIQADPSPNQTDFVTWIARMLSKGLMRLPEDTEEIKGNLTAFQTQRRRPAFGGSKDINSYATPADLSDTIQQNAMVVVRNKDVEKFRNMTGARMVAQKGDLTIFKATEADACAVLSDSTKWCTRHGQGGGSAEHYIRRGPSYIAFYHGAPFAQLHPASNQFMDKRDEPFIKEYYQQPESSVYRRYRRKQQGPLIGRAISSPVAQTMVELLRPIAPDVEQWFQKQELIDPKELAKLLKGPSDNMTAAVLSGVPLSPEDEDRLFKDDEPQDYTVWNKLWDYSEKFHPGERWEPLERTIKKNLRKNLGYAIRYAKERIKGRWKEIEPFIVRNAAINDWHAGQALDYAVNVVKGRWRELESKFWTTKSTDTMPELAYKYAVEVLKKPWRDAEDQPGLFPYGMIKPEMLMALNTPEIALKYAEHFNIKPWPELARILLASKQLDWYVRYLSTLGGKERDPRLEARLLSPVPETETETIYPTEQEVANYSYYHPGETMPNRTETHTLNKDGLANQYDVEVLGGQRWPEFEQKLLREASDKASSVIPTDFRLMEGGSSYSSNEDRIPDPFATYLKRVIKGRWPELEQVLLQRYEDYPDIWESNQAFLSGYLNLVSFLTKGKHPVAIENEGQTYSYNRREVPSPTGIWAAGEARLRERNPDHEAALTQKAVAAMRELEVNPQPPEEFDDKLYHEQSDLRDYILFLRKVGNEWPEGLKLIRQLENIIEDRGEQLKTQGKYRSSLYNRLSSHALLHPRRLTTR